MNVCDFAMRMTEECVGGGAGEEECPPVIVSWEGAADIQSGDILIVRIADSLLLDTFGQLDVKNGTPDANVSNVDGERSAILIELKNCDLYRHWRRGDG